MAFQCPHCRNNAYTRTSRHMSLQTKESYFQCENIACGYTFKVLAQIVCTLVQSANPDPLVAAAVPFSPLKLARPEQLDLIDSIRSSKPVSGANKRQGSGEDCTQGSIRFIPGKYKK